MSTEELRVLLVRLKDRLQQRELQNNELKRALNESQEQCSHWQNQCRHLHQQTAVLEVALRREAALAMELRSEVKSLQSQLEFKTSDLQDVIYGLEEQLTGRDSEVAALQRALALASVTPAHAQQVTASIIPKTKSSPRAKRSSSVKQSRSVSSAFPKTKASSNSSDSTSSHSLDTETIERRYKRIKRALKRTRAQLAEHREALTHRQRLEAALELQSKPPAPVAQPLSRSVSVASLTGIISSVSNSLQI